MTVEPGGQNENRCSCMETEYAAMARDAGLGSGPAVPLPPSPDRLMELFV